ncbi:MAG: phosphoribosyltransferase family protein, partial [Planctomycetota bacterium]|jgi:adenine phosphoribosyltransferase
VRKPGKLPWNTVRVTYDLEYGRDALEIHSDAVRAGDRVLIIDDLLATGGTAAAACTLVEKLGAKVVGLCVAVELTFLEGRGKLEGRRVEALVRF